MDAEPVAAGGAAAEPEAEAAMALQVMPGSAGLSDTGVAGTIHLSTANGDLFFVWCHLIGDNLC
jgi:hypothetical protein